MVGRVPWRKMRVGTECERVDRADLLARNLSTVTLRTQSYTGLCATILKSVVTCSIIWRTEEVMHRAGLGPEHSRRRTD
jgi:hypothetical protein